MPRHDAEFRGVDDSRIVPLPKIADPRGNLTFVESNGLIPFTIRRTYWVYDVPGGEERSHGHAYRRNDEFIIALSGSFEVTVDDSGDPTTYQLNRSYVGLHVPATLWRRVDNFSTNAVCLVLCSEAFSADDYIRDRDVFTKWRGGRA